MIEWLGGKAILGILIALWPPAELGGLAPPSPIAQRGRELDSRAEEIEELLGECRKTPEERFREGAGLVDSEQS